MFTDAAGLEAPRNGIVWVVQVLGAMLLLIAGSAKLSGGGQMIPDFDAVGAFIKKSFSVTQRLSGA